ncbi:MAG: hypothetical protein PHE68_06015 [Candidatus Peribacteraceae bacterium]|nr:hypothetical protein [Candidatus Peribacteraceae bacterium]MDD5074667.1 hypothetical protein [Candidatus Peribacteraceae bacterium]
MDKHELLRQISDLAGRNLLTEEEVLGAVRRRAAKGPRGLEHVKLTEVLYYLGGFIIILGIVILLGQNWELLNSFTRILVTLGSGVAAYIVGILFQQKDYSQKLTIPFFFLSAVILPIGLFVTFNEAGIQTDDAGINTVISGILLATFLASYFLLKRTIFLLFSIIFGTWLFFAFTSFLFGGNPALGWRFYAYRVLATGLTFILLGHSFRTMKRESALTGLLFGFGIFGFLGAALALGGWTPEQSMIWELVFPGIVFAVIFLSIPLKSKSFLIIGALYLMAYIIKITSEYFSQSFGWPLSLVILGFLLIGIGFLSFHLNRKYLST